MVENTKVQYMRREQITRLLVNKGVLLAKLDKRDEASRAFSAAAALEEIPAAGQSPVWKHWGEYLENIFFTNQLANFSPNYLHIVCYFQHRKHSIKYRYTGNCLFFGVCAIPIGKV